MATFPTNLAPNERVFLIGGSPFIDVGNGGRITTKANESLGLEWTETYNLDLQSSASVNWLAKVEFIFANGQVVTNKKFHANLLGAGGTLKVSGSGQTGTSIIIYGAAGNSTPLLAGDLVQIGTGSLVHQIGADCTADASGGATMSIMPQILDGFQPAQTSSLTLTPFVSFSCVMTGLTIGEYSPRTMQAPISIKFRQTPV